MYSLSFSEEFFTGYPTGNIGEQDLSDCYAIIPRPQCVLEALLSESYKDPDSFKNMVKDVLGYNLKDTIEECIYWELLDKIREYNTCDTLTPPIKVYINEDYFITVYEDIEGEVA